MKKRYVTDEDGCVYPATQLPETLERNRLVRKIRLLRKTIEQVLGEAPTPSWLSFETGNNKRWFRHHSLLTKVLEKTAPKRTRRA